MRAIKFRAWHKEFKLMGLVDSFYFAEKSAWVVGEGINFQYQLSELEVMQFTGLKDKNGVEIYEGDIAKYQSTTFKSQKWIGVVMWQEFRGCWAIGKPGAYNNDLFKYVQNGGWCEVIGNIHQHSDLLQSELERASTALGRRTLT
jgi:uncharacterized phage protein (TIGR01671 family)